MTWPHRYRSSILWSRRLGYRAGFFIFLGLLAVLWAARAQHQVSGEALERERCNHGRHEVWDGLRVLPVRFIRFDDNTAFWKHQAHHIMKVGAFVVDENTQYISREKKRVAELYVMERKGSEWLCYYCSNCHALLKAYELRAGSSSLE